MLVGYHSHGGDFKKFDGKTAWEIFFDNTKPEVVHQIDIGNTLDGGGDPLAMIRSTPAAPRPPTSRSTAAPRARRSGRGPTTGRLSSTPTRPSAAPSGTSSSTRPASNPLQSVKTCLDNLHKMGR